MSDGSTVGRVYGPYAGHKTDDVFRRYNVTATEDLELAADRLAVYRDARAKAIIEKANDVVVH